MCESTPQFHPLSFMVIAEPVFLHTRRHFRGSLSKSPMAEKEAQDSVSASDTILKVLAAEDSIPQSTGSATRTVTSVVRSTSSSSTGNGHHTQYQVQTIQTAGKTGVEPSETGRTPTQSHSVSLPEITSAVEKQEGTASDGGPSGLPDVARTWRSEPSFQTGTYVMTCLCIVVEDPHPVRCDRVAQSLGSLLCSLSGEYCELIICQNQNFMCGLNLEESAIGSLFYLVLSPFVVICV